MENASKALIMAGTVLISILLISILVLFFRKGASASAEYNSAMSDAELAKFNAKFEVYDRNNNTYFDVITVVNLAYTINKTNENDSQNQITVTLEDNNSSSTNTYIFDSTCEENVFSNGTNIYTLVPFYTNLVDRASQSEGKKYEYLFKCSEISYSDVTGKVKSMKFDVLKN